MVTPALTVIFGAFDYLRFVVITFQPLQIWAEDDFLVGSRDAIKVEILLYG